jgi:hypothetical protein
VRLTADVRENIETPFPKKRSLLELICPMDALIHILKTGIINTAFLRLFLEAKKK